MTRNKWSLQMKILVAVVSMAAVFAAIAGVIYGISASNKEDILVIPVSDADYGSEDDYSNTIDGRVTTGSSQSVLYDPDKPIVKIQVKKGVRVQKGSPLILYDSQQAAEELEQKELDVRSVEVGLKRAQRTLDTLNAVQQLVVPEEEEEPEDEEETEEGGSIEKEDEDTAKAPADGEDASADESNESAAESEDPEAGAAEDGAEDTGPDLSDYQPGEVVYVDNAGEVYSAVELRKAKIEAENEIRSLTTDLAEANANLAAAQKAVADDTVTSTLDGVVTQVNNPKKKNLEAGEVVITVSTFEGFFVETALNEWTLGTVDIGSKIYVKSWHSGKVYPAKITDISPYASPELAQHYSDDETDDSYYPMTARIEKDNVKLSDGDSVEVSLTKPEEYEGDEDEKDPIYLYKAFVVNEGGKKYVYKADENGKLIKQELEVTGQETETYIVTGGITEDDYIAFPYSEGVREGANTVEGEIDDLYEDYY